jgi:hypothetical protein
MDIGASPNPHPSLAVRWLLFAAGWWNSSLFFHGLFCPAGG